MEPKSDSVAADENPEHMASVANDAGQNHQDWKIYT